MPAGLFPSRGSREELGPGLFQLLMAANVPWLMAASLQCLLCHIAFSSALKSLSLIGTLFLTFREDQDKVSISRSLIQSQLQSSFCHMRLYSQIPGIWIWMSLRTVNQPTASFLASRFSGPSQMARLIL